MENTTAIYTEGLPSKIIKRAMPVFMLTFIQALHGALDLVMVGWFSAPTQVVAVSTGSQITYAVTLCLLGIATGGTILINKYRGAGMVEDMCEAAGAMAALAVIIGLIFAVLLLVFSKVITVIMNVPAEAFVYAKNYISICSAGAVFVAGYTFISGILRGVADVMHGFAFAIVGCITNILFNLWFVAYLDLGAEGAAVATMISQAVCFMYAYLYVRDIELPVKISLKSILKHKEMIGYSLRLGVPLGLQELFVHMAFLFTTMIINQMGIINAAAVGVSEKLMSLLMLVPISISTAVAAISANAMGHGNSKRAKASMKIGMMISGAVSMVLFLLLQLFPNFIDMVIKDDSIAEQASLYLAACSFDCVIMSFVMCMESYLCSIGRTFHAMIATMIGIFMVRLPLIILISMSHSLTLFEKGMVMPISSTITLIIMLIMYAWRNHNVRHNHVVHADMFDWD